MQSNNSFSSEKIYTLMFLGLFWGALLVPFILSGHIPEISMGQVDMPFFGQAQLINGIVRLRMRAGDRVFPQVLVGENGWLNYTAENNMDYHQNAPAPTGQSIAQSGAALWQLKETLQARGVKLLVVIAPNKETIYPQYVSAGLPLLGEKSGSDQLVEFFHTRNADDLLLDLRPALKTASATDQVYYKTDTHWNDMGAYIAQREILLRMQANFPSVQPYPLKRYNYPSVGAQRMDLTKILGLTAAGEELFSLKPKFKAMAKYSALTLANGRKVYSSANPDQRLPRVLVYHDSFFSALIPIIGEQLGNALFLPHTVENDFFSWLDHEQPELVIFEIVERDLFNIPAYLQKNPAP